MNEALQQPCVAGVRIGNLYRQIDFETVEPSNVDEARCLVLHI